MLKRTFDEDVIRSILTHEDIFKNIGGKDDKNFPIPIDEENHYLVFEGGLFIFHKEGDAWKCHANVLKRSREHALEAGEKALEYAFNELKAETLTATIPTRFPNVYRYARRLGFNLDKTENEKYQLSLRYEQWAG